MGSGNIGATNVFRILGKTAGVFVLLADAAKGWLAVVLVAKWVADWFYPAAGPLAHEWFRLCAGIAAILGHNYTCWLHFKGGKGIATSAGVLVALVWLPLLIILGVWIVVFAVSRYVSLASICASFALPFATWFTGEESGDRYRHGGVGGPGDLQAQGQHQAAAEGHGEPDPVEEDGDPRAPPKATA